ncbi:MAG: hypothetical protein ACR5LD_09565 [Symbiopectobacterium sp.]
MVSANFSFRREGQAGDRKVGLHRCGGVLMDIGVTPSRLYPGFQTEYTIHDHRCC